MEDQHLKNSPYQRIWKGHCAPPYRDWLQHIHTLEILSLSFALLENLWPIISVYIMASRYKQLTLHEKPRKWLGMNLPSQIDQEVCLDEQKCEEED